MKVYAGYIDENGIWDCSIYIKYFAENVQERAKNTRTGEFINDGMTLDELQDEGSLMEVYNLLLKMDNDPEMRSLLEELETKVGIELDLINYANLVYGINLMTRSYYLLYLKPTVKEMLDTLGEITDIKFNDKVSIQKPSQIKAITQFIKDNLQDEDLCIVDKIKRADKVFNKMFFQSKFVQYLSRFMSMYFKDAKRRKNSCIVSSTEQRLILKTLSFINLAPEGLTESRFRQIISYAKNRNFMFMPIRIENKTFNFAPVRYSAWSRKDFDFDMLNNEEINPLVGVSICFPPTSKLLECFDE